MIILQQKPFAKLQPVWISRCRITKILICHCTDYEPNTLKDSMHKTDSVVTSGRFWHIFTSYLRVNASLSNAPCSVLNIHLSFNWTFNSLPAKEFSLLMQILSHSPPPPPKKKSCRGVQPIGNIQFLHLCFSKVRRKTRNLSRTPRRQIFF